MTALENTDDVVLRIVGTQAPDYLIHPDATAFMAVGLTPDVVSESLTRLVEAGLAVHLEAPLVNVVQTQIIIPNDVAQIVETEEQVYDENGNPVILDEGFSITDQGREVLAALPPSDPLAPINQIIEVPEQI